MDELKLIVPTYNYDLFPEQVEKGEMSEFGAPDVSVLVRQADGVRIVLGTHDYGDLEKPNIQIERHPKGWMIFLHPCPGGDPSGYVYFLDDGRSFLVKETNVGPTEAIEVLEADARIPEIHWDKTAQEDSEKSCGRCGRSTEDSGDWYGDLCPSCADETEGKWVCRYCKRQGSFEEMGGSGALNPICCGSLCDQIKRDSP
jgi:hypothetical protein